MILLDTNILVYAHQEDDPHHMAAKSLRDQGMQGNIPVCISPQVLSEFFATVTNARRVTQPLTPAEARAEIEKYIRIRHIRKIYPKHGVLNRVRHLLGQHEVKGQNVFDLFLVATMLENDVHRIYTYNTSDFIPFSDEIEVLAPPVDGLSFQ